jgi:hypothetical protein
MKQTLHCTAAAHDHDFTADDKKMVSNCPTQKNLWPVKRQPQLQRETREPAGIFLEVSQVVTIVALSQHLSTGISWDPMGFNTLAM